MIRSKVKGKQTVSELAIPFGGISSRATAEIRVRDMRPPTPLSTDDTAEQASERSWSETKPAIFSDRRNGHVDKATKAKLEKLEDAELLSRFQSGEEGAFYVLFERRHKEIYTHCYRMCARDAEKANDAFQDTFVKVFTRKDLFTDASNGRAWLYRIATNTCLNALRYDKRHPTEGLQDTHRSVNPSMQPDFATEQGSLREALETAVAKLPKELREPFILRELEEFSYEEVSEQLGITVAAARQRIYRAKMQLRDELEDLVNG
jgi:RNA polymerase sigma-70 factor (ECF subfamily)